jgi:hypothetical protein
MIRLQCDIRIFTQKCLFSAEINGTDTIQYHYNLQVATHYWFWDMFVFNKRFDEKAARTPGARHYNAAKSKEQDLGALRTL